MPSSNHAEVSVCCCPGKQTVMSSRTLLSDLVLLYNSKVWRTNAGLGIPIPFWHICSEVENCKYQLCHIHLFIILCLTEQVKNRQIHFQEFWYQEISLKFASTFPSCLKSDNSRHFTYKDQNMFLQTSYVRLDRHEIKNCR